MGRITVVVAMLIAVLVAPLLGIDKKGGFQYIQEYTGFISPGVFAMFILGFFWKKTTSNAALFATIGGFFLSIVFKFLPGLVDLSFLVSSGFAKANASGTIEIPFLDRMFFVFAICVVVMVIMSHIEHQRGHKTNGLEIDRSMFRVDSVFGIGALLITGILAALYTVLW